MHPEKFREHRARTSPRKIAFYVVAAGMTSRPRITNAANEGSRSPATDTRTREKVRFVVFLPHELVLGL